MSKSNFLLQITNGIWLIEPSAIQQFGPVVKNLLEKNPKTLTGKVKTLPLAIMAEGAMGRYALGGTMKDAPQGSIAVLNISGAIMKEDNCGDAGTETMGMLVKSADNNPNISAIVLRIDSPGGTVAGTEDFANIIKNCSKPTIALVNGMMCSAAYWIGSSCDEAYISNQTDMVGSIGTMLSFADAQPMWEKEGVVFHEIYADASKDKNQDFAAARQGNYDAIKKNLLNPINTTFLNAVKTNRGNQLNTKETLTGKVFLGNDAVGVGLVDGVKSFDEAMARAQELAPINNNNNQNQKPMKLKAAWTAMTAFLSGLFTDVKAEMVLTEEHLEKMEAELASLPVLKKAKEDAEALLATANTTITTLTSEKTALATENERLGKLHGTATATNKTATAEGDGSAAKASFETDEDRELAEYKAKMEEGEKK